MEVIKSFVHVLLFECSQCGRPILACIMSDDRSPEGVDATSFALKCHCHTAIEVPGAAAKRHWVESWQSTSETPVSQGSQRLQRN